MILTRASGATRCQCICQRNVPKNRGRIRGNFGQISRRLEPARALMRLYSRNPARYDPPAIRIRLRSPERNFMHITVAHISPIMSLIAGVLILIMPRLLNLIVAIFLILNGLIGLGLLKWLRF
jgi:hypothetical protein